MLYQGTRRALVVLRAKPHSWTTSPQTMEYLMTTEIRLRLNADCKSTFQAAADRHGVPLVHFITMAVHGYLRGIGDLSAIQPAPVAPVAPTSAPVKPEPDVLTAVANAFDDDDDEWTEEELAYWRAKGRDISTG